jgi:hypothetical protein
MGIFLLLRRAREECGTLEEQGQAFTPDVTLTERRKFFKQELILMGGKTTTVLNCDNFHTLGTLNNGLEAI